MGNSDTLKRTIGSVSFKLNDKVTLASGLPRNYVYERLLLRLTLNITIVTAAATAFAEGMWKIIKRIEIVKGGKDTIKSYDGAALARMVHEMYGNLPNYSTLPTAVGAGQAHNASFILDFSMPRMVEPIRSALRVNSEDTLDFVVTWGGPSDIYSANAANATINSGALTITSLEDTGGDIHPDFIHKNYVIEKQVSASTPNFSIPLTGANLYRGFLIYSDVDGSPNNLIINSVELKNGVRSWAKVNWPELQDENKIVQDTEVIPSGWGFLDLAPAGMITQLLDSKGMTDLMLNFDVSLQAGTTNLIRVYPLELQKVGA